MSRPLRLVFLGSDPIALPMLDALAQGEGVAKVIGVFTQPDRPVGRGQKIQPGAIKAWAIARGIPVLQPEKITGDVRLQLEAFAADVALVMAYGHILRDDFIATPRLGILNLHTSILPKYRGASPIQSAIASGDRETGVTLMRIVRKLDAGPLADAERVPIESLDTALEVEARLSAACVALVTRSLPGLAEGSLTFTAQDESAATYCRKLEKADGILDFTSSASKLAARINGLFPWPTCRIDVNGESLKLGLADRQEAGEAQPALAETATKPGIVIGADKEGLLVGTGEGVLRLRRLQRPGGRMLPAAEFLRGFSIPAGTLINSGPMSQLVETRS